MVRLPFCSLAMLLNSLIRARAAHLSSGHANTIVRRITPRPRRVSQGEWFVVTKGREVGVFQGW